MTQRIEEIVRRAVARHLEIESAALRSHDRFADLSLKPLDVVLIALQIEEVEAIDVPVDRLDGVETIADLTALVRRARDEHRRLGEPAFPRPRRDGGRGVITGRGSRWSLHRDGR